MQKPANVYPPAPTHRNVVLRRRGAIRSLPVLGFSLCGVHMLVSSCLGLRPPQLASALSTPLLPITATGVEIASFVVVFGGVILLFAPWVCRAKRYRQHFTARFTLCTACRYPLEPLGQAVGKCPECGRRFSFEHHPRLLRMSGYRDR